MRFKVPILVHDFTEYVSVGKGRSLGEKEFVLLFFGSLFPENGSGMQSVELECESPSFGISVIFFEYIDTSDVFPEINWFLDGLDVQKAEKGRLACS